MSLRALIVVPLALGCSQSARTLPGCNTDAIDAAVPGSDPRLLAAGDVETCNDPASERTAQLLDRLPGTVAMLGDAVYESGSLNGFLDCYARTWGRHRARTRPCPGNHDYRSPRAGPYFAYFCGVAGETYKGWYGYDLARWHVVVLNSNCDFVDCTEGSEQLRWLRDDLAAHPARCTLAYFHHPRFNSGGHGNEARVSPMWSALYAHGVELVLNGHQHMYERFAPQAPSGVADPLLGVRQFTVGTGGHPPSGPARSIANSEVILTDVDGVLALTLHDDGYDFQFIDDSGRVRDEGRGVCH
jgi:3',5'-cyclic AMP phosphodiesterase CpdA